MAEHMQYHKSQPALTLTGRQMTMRRRSAVARLARKVLVGDLKEDFRITVKMIRMLPHTPRQNVKLQIK